MEQRSAMMDRRLAVGGGLAAAVGLTWPHAQNRVRVITQRGIAGGGLVRFAEGEAEFSLSASSLTTTDDGVESAPVFLGSVVWVDGSVGLTLESTRITNYENLQLAEGEGRRVEGFFAAGVAEEQPFVEEQPFMMEAVHFALPGLGADRVRLLVGSAILGDAATPEAEAGFTYEADGEIVFGDVQTADVGVDLDTGEVFQPEPR